MKLNLDKTTHEIEEYLQAQDFVVFHGFSRHEPTRPLALWDTGHRPDFREFLATARALGVKLVALRIGKLGRHMLDETRERMHDADLPTEELRRMEKQVRDLRRYEGFTCSVELAFDFEGRTYIFDLQTEWYLEFLRLSEEIDEFMPFEDDEDGPDDLSDDLFSRN